MKSVVLVTVGSLRSGHVGWAGYERDTTLRLDEWAADGHVYVAAYEREINATSRDTEAVEMDDATKDQLRNFGYVK